jgi:hypothetical protein
LHNSFVGWCKARWSMMIRTRNITCSWVVVKRTIFFKQTIKSNAFRRDKLAGRHIAHSSPYVSRSRSSTVGRPLYSSVCWIAYLTVRVSLLSFCDINEASCGIYKVLRPVLWSTIKTTSLRRERCSNKEPSTSCSPIRKNYSCQKATYMRNSKYSILQCWYYV